MLRSFHLGWLGCVLVACAAPFARANVGTALPLNQYQAGTETTTLIPNGDFESGSTGYTATGNATTAAPINPPSPASTVGALAFQASTTNSIDGGDFTTINPIPLDQNTQYIISAYMWDFSGFNEINIKDASAATTSLALERFDGSGDPFFVYSSPINGSDFPNGLVLQAEGSPIPIAGPGLLVQTDNIAITPVSQFAPPTPEPTSLGLLALGGVLLLRRSRRASAAS